MVKYGRERSPYFFVLFGSYSVSVPSFCCIESIHSSGDFRILYSILYGERSGKVPLFDQFVSPHVICHYCKLLMPLL